MSNSAAPLTDPAAQGWIAEPLSTSPFVRQLGQIWHRRDEDGIRLAFTVLPSHANPNGVAHGGVVLTFADFTIGEIGARLTGNPNAVTIDIDLQFISAAQIGDFLVGTGKVLRKTQSLLFLEGEIHCADRQVASFTGVWKYFKPGA